MPDLEWNSSYWDGRYDWKGRGEEWSKTWGGSEPQWFGSLYPRIHRLLPATAILEIAPGFGRWTKFLLPHCRNYIGIDLSSECVAACKEAFLNMRHAAFFENDGLSLEMAQDDHFDLVFSFDSLVHAEAPVLAKYIPQILQKLTSTGVAFLHHSNLAALPSSNTNLHSRAVTVSADIVMEMIIQQGGKVLVQEVINWGHGLTDCLSLFSNHLYATTATPVIIENRRFMDEASLIRETHAHYSNIEISSRLMFS